MRVGFTDDELYALTAIDPWFLAQIRRIVAAEQQLKGGDLGPEQIRACKRLGFSDRQIASLVGGSEDDVRASRLASGTRAVYARVDTCAAEFVAHTPYLYSTYETESEAKPDATKRKVVILGGGPNRIGQGIEFDYCCVHAVMALRELGFETVMVNCNPETVSTDYDTSDRLYFEPLTLEDVLDIVDEEKPDGVIVQFGGQTPLKLAVPLEKRGVKLLGTTRRRDRSRRGPRAVRRASGQAGAQATTQRHRAGAERGHSHRRGHRLSGARAPELRARRAGDDDRLHARRAGAFVTRAFEAAREAGTQTILVDEFLKDAIEVDVDCVADGKRRRHRRRDAAHRRGRRPLRRFVERAAAAFALARDRPLASRSRRGCSRSSSAWSG